MVDPVTPAQGRYQYEGAFASKAAVEAHVKKMVTAEELPEADGAYICDLVDDCPELAEGTVYLLTVHGNKTATGAQRFANVKTIPFTA